MSHLCPRIMDSGPVVISTVFAGLLDCADNQWGVYPAAAGLFEQVFDRLDIISAGAVVEYDRQFAGVRHCPSAGASRHIFSKGEPIDVKCVDSLFLRFDLGKIKED